MIISILAIINGCLIILIAVIMSTHKSTLTLTATQVICKTVFIIKNTIFHGILIQFYFDLCKISSIAKVVVLVFYANLLVADTSDSNH